VKELMRMFCYSVIEVKFMSNSAVHYSVK